MSSPPSIYNTYIFELIEKLPMWHAIFLFFLVNIISFIYSTKFDWMPTVPGTVQRAWETPMKKQMDIVGRAYICSCYFLKYFFPINHAGSAAKLAGILEQHSRVQKSLAKYSEWSIRPVPRNMASNLYHNVPGPAGSNSQGYLIIW